MTGDGQQRTEADQADHRADVYVEGERTIYRASALGGCVRALVAARTGYTPVAPTDKQRRYMAEGVLHEPAVVGWLEAEGWAMGRTQDQVELEVAGHLTVRGHTDGVGTRAGSERVVEIKAPGQDTWKKFVSQGIKASRRYEWQLSVYMHALGLPGLFVAKNRNTGEVHVIEVDEPPIGLTAIKARVIKVEAAAARGDLMACDPMAYPCGFYYLHDEQEMFPEQTMDEALDAICETVDRFRVMEAQGKAGRQEAAKRLLEAMGTREKVRTPHWQVAHVNYKRTSLDTKTLREDHPEIVAPYERVTETEYPRVTKLGEKGK
jgi:hypothetical protein